MADNLPLIPDTGAVCTDVRAVLREVFRELECLPPLGARHVAPGPDTRPPRTDDTCPDDQRWIEKFKTECKELQEHEVKLQQERARHVARAALRNKYHLLETASQRSPANTGRLLRREHLVPAVEKNASRNASLWVRNILTSSSCESSSTVVLDKLIQSPGPLRPTFEDLSLQSLSIGEATASPSTPPPPPFVSPSPPPPEYIICVPPRLEFVNFTVGQMHSQSLRLVNVSRLELRLSVRPPAQHALHVELHASRGLALSAGATIKLRVQFTPRDARSLRDELHVRVSSGRHVIVPIACYMRPPVLDVLVPEPSVRREPSMPLSGADSVLDLGARLLGDVHYAPLVLHCRATHAAFFMLTEDSWLDFSLQVVQGMSRADDVLSAGPFAVRPVCWAGGGTVRGAAWCRAPRAGLHTVALRVLATTVATRSLHVLADALLYSPHHVTLQAQEKDYAADSEDDPACEYFVHLGTAFPRRVLDASVQLVNHSPVAYAYYWLARRWGASSCGQQEHPTSLQMENGLEGKHPDPRGMQDSEDSEKQPEPEAVQVEPGCGRAAPRSSLAVRLRAAAAGAASGVHRAALMLILKDVPKESFPPGYDPTIVSSKLVESEPIPGVQPWIREVCDVVCCQLEVWWEVVPVRFVLDPPILMLTHSRRVRSARVSVRATQLSGRSPLRVAWRRLASPTPAGPPGRDSSSGPSIDDMTSTATSFSLEPEHSYIATLQIPLASLPDDKQETDIITMVAENGECRSQVAVVRRCVASEPRLRPPLTWLGVVVAGTTVAARLHLRDAQRAARGDAASDGEGSWSWSWRRWRGRKDRGDCHEKSSCTVGRVLRGGDDYLHYTSTAPQTEGPVATLVELRRDDGQLAAAALVACRVLAPALVVSVEPHEGDKATGAHCGGVVRAAPLAVGRPVRTRLHVTNTTPMDTTVEWEPALEGDDVLGVTFSPNKFDVGSYETVDVQVELLPRLVCGRRVFLRRAAVALAHSPLYLVVDTAIQGVEVTCDVPLGAGAAADTVLTIRRTQREVYPWETPRGTLPPHDLFAEYDRRREVQRGPVTETVPLTDMSLSTVCSKPLPSEHTEAYCLQWTQLPLATVSGRTLTLRNESMLIARWSATVRKWPRVRKRTLAQDQWASDIRDPGLAIQVSPPSGELAAGSATHLEVQVYADCWGLYRDQILLQVENVEPIILDVWVEAVGGPLQFAIKPTDDGELPVVWMSYSDARRTVRARNTSRSRLDVRAYLLRQHEHNDDRLPFRLYLRFLDTPFCPCSTVNSYSDSFTSDDDSHDGTTVSSSTVTEEMDSTIELFLAPDYGIQCDTSFKVEPLVSVVEAGAHASWTVTLVPLYCELAADAVLLLRCVPLDFAGAGWCRPEPGPQCLCLRRAPRAARLQPPPRELRVTLCALHLPHNEVLRVRKRFKIQNVGDGPLSVTAQTQSPWSIVEEQAGGADCGCRPRRRLRRDEHLLHIEANSSTEICVEVCVHSAVVCPVVCAAGSSPLYAERSTTTTPLIIKDQHNVLLSVRLVLEIEFPLLHIEPAVIDFGFVTDGDSRKSYFTIKHTSRDETIDLVAQWTGSEGFELWPERLLVAPRVTERIYVQYTSKWVAAPAEGCMVVAARAAAWCAGCGRARARPALDARLHRAPHDHTDDTRLLPHHGHTTATDATD